MVASVAVARTASNTTTGNQDITTTNLGGVTPDAAIVIVTQASSDGTHEDDAVLSIGVTDGTNAYCAQANAEHGVGTADTHRSYDDNAVIKLEVPGTSTTDGLADVVSFVTNGIRINWSNAPIAAYYIHAILFAGLDNASAGNAVLGSQDSAVDVTGPGFEPTNVFCIFGDRRVNDGANTAAIGFGFCENGGDQVSVCFASANNTSEGSPDVEQRSAYVCGRPGGEYIEISAFDSSGFSLTPRSAAGLDCGYLAIDIGSTSSHVAAVDLPSSTGNDSITGVGFTPNSLIYASVLATANDTQYSDRGYMGIAAYDGTDEYSAQICDEDAAATTNTSSWSDDSFSFQDDDGTALYTGTVSSLDSDGWTINWSAVDGSGRKAIAFALGESATTVTLLTNTITIDGETVTVSVEKIVTLVDSALSIEGQTLTASADSIVQVEMLDGSMSVSLEGPFTLTVGITPDYGILELDGGQLKTNPSREYAQLLTSQIQVLGESVRILVSDTINECKRIWKRLPDTYVLTDLVARVRFIETEYSLTGYTIDLSRSIRVSEIFETGALEITGYAPTLSYPDSIIVTNPILSNVFITGYSVNVLGDGITFDPTSGLIEIDLTLANAYTSYGETEILSAGSGSPDVFYLSAVGEICTNDGTTENAIDLNWAAGTNLKVIIQYGSGFMEMSVYVNNVDYYSKTVAFDGTYGGSGTLDVSSPANITINDFGYQ